MSSYYEKKLATGEVKCIDEEIPFEVPKGWEWCRLSALTTRFSTGPFGTMLHKEDYTDNGVAVINPTNIINHKISLNNIKQISFAKAKELQGYAVNKGDIILARRGDLRKSAIITDFEDSCIAGTGSFIFHLLGIVNSFFILFYISPYVQDYLITDSIGTTMNNLNQKLLSRLLIPIPSRAEQVRIVSVVDELFPLVNTYDMMKNKLDILNSSLHENIKKSILQEAIQGKLVPQIAEEGTAQELLEQIKAEKQRLVKEGKLKKSALNDSIIFRGDDNKYYTIDKKEKICIDDEIPFDIPDTWEWCRLGTLFSHCTGKALNASNLKGSLMTYITTSNLYWNRFELDNLKRMRFTEEEIEKCTATFGDLLVCEGGDIGRAAIWNYPYDIRIQNHIHKLRAYKQLCTKFFFWVFYFYKTTGRIGGKGIGIQGLSSKALDNILIPLPPLKEQQRIVSQIEKLFKQFG